MTILSLPKFYIIEVTNLCNFSCPICPNLFYNTKQKGNMIIDLYSNILDEIKEVAEVIQLYWMGEPLLNPNIGMMIRLCKEKTKAKVILSTNGSKLSAEIIKSVVKSGLDEIIVSVDACESQEIYGAIRVGGKIEDLNSNIQYLLKNKKGMHVVLQFIDMYINRFEKRMFLEKWKDQGCTISISCLYSWANQIPSLNLASDNLSPVAKKKRIPCSDLWNKMAIHWDGRVSACCFDWDFKLVIGNCTFSSLKDIWNGNPLCKLRNLHEKGDYSHIPICRKCDSWAEPDEYEALFNLCKS